MKAETYSIILYFCSILTQLITHKVVIIFNCYENFKSYVAFDYIKNVKLSHQTLFLSGTPETWWMKEMASST